MAPGVQGLSLLAQLLETLPAEVGPAAHSPVSPVPSRLSSAGRSGGHWDAELHWGAVGNCSQQGVGAQDRSVWLQRRDGPSEVS